MIEGNVNVWIFFIVFSSKQNVKQQLRRGVHTSLKTGMMQSYCNVAPKKKLIYKELI